MKRILVIVVAALLCGCTPLTFAVVGQSVDAATTWKATCQSDYEVSDFNVFSGIGNGDCTETILIVTLTKVGVLSVVYAICKPKECPITWRILGSLGFVAGVSNAYLIKEAEE